MHDHFYGTPLPEVKTTLEQGLDLIFDIDVQGAASLKQNLPEALFIFILPPSFEVLKERLIKRGTDSKETIQKRLHNAKKEIEEALWYDALIVNDDLEQAYAELRACYLTRLLAPRFKKELLANLLNS
ncbi:MAG: hypothetical protein IJU40_01170 [Desulfovibrionaceae bacterium]|nr:hypothetical protein [Desulfovibrionaceae bacterium]